ncbi:MAG: glycosyltransferase [Candidatus Nanohalobium sp.]
MELAVYHPYLKEKGGAEKVVLEYAKRSENDVTVFTMFYDEEATFSGFQDVDVDVVSNRRGPESFFAQAKDFIVGGMFQKLDLKGFDALLVSETGAGSVINFRNHDLPILGYCHTPLRAALPEFKDTYRAGFHPVLRPFYSVMTAVFNMMESYAWRYFDVVAANSEVTKQRVLEKGLVGKDKVSVVNPGVETDTQGSESYEKYFFYPSRFEPYKRQELAIEAFEEAELDGFELVLAGSSADENYISELEERAGENVSIETDVDGERWEELYSNCYSVLFLSEKEDWGIVPLEAGTYEKPVIAVNEGGPRNSVVDGETGFLVEAEKEAIAEKMRFLAENEKKVKNVGRKGRENAKKYSWENFAEKIDGLVSGLQD